jgi:hypothetical protein
VTSHSVSASGLCVLTTDSDAPVVTDTSVSSDLLQSLEIFTELDVDVVREDLGVFTVLDVLLSVEEPVWHTVLSWVLHNGDELLDFIFSQLTGTLVEVNLSHLAAQVGESTSTTLDLGECKHNLTLTSKVGVHHTQHVLERFRHHKRLQTMIQRERESARARVGNIGLDNCAVPRRRGGR